MIRKFVASLFLPALLATAGYAQSIKTSPVWLSQGKLASAISVTNTSAATLLPASGFVAWVCNTGSNDAYIALGQTNAVTATAAGSSWLKASTCAAYDLDPQIGTNYTYLAAITGSSTTSLQVETGTGSPPVQSGSSGGGGGSVTQGTVPWIDSVTTWGGGALGAMASYGTSPGAVLVPGVNAFITNTPTVTASAGTNLNTSLLALESGGNLAAIKVDTDKIPSQGQALAAGSMPVVLPAAQITTLTPPAAITGFALETGGNLATLAGGVTSSVYQENLKQVNGVTLLTGAGATGTGSPRETVAQDTTTIAGSAPGTAGTPSANVVTTQPPTAGQVAVSVAPTTAGNTAQVFDLRPDSPGIIALGPAAVSGSVPVASSSQYPTNAVTTTPQPVTATATGTTAATVATLPAVAGKTTYICGFTITADATSLAVGTATVAGTISGSLSYLQGVQASTSGAGILTQSFNPCVPASAANTAITVTSAAAGTGGNTIVNAQGYYL